MQRLEAANETVREMSTNIDAEDAQRRSDYQMDKQPCTIDVRVSTRLPTAVSWTRLDWTVRTADWPDFMTFVFTYRIKQQREIKSAI